MMDAAARALLLVCLAAALFACEGGDPAASVVAPHHTRRADRPVLKPGSPPTPAQPSPAASAEPPTAAERAKLDLGWETILDRRRSFEGAVSTGTTLEGRLRGEAVRLAHEGRDHLILKECRPRETNYATEEVVALLEDTAAAMRRDFPEGPKLAVCNMSKRGGGNIPWSRSHNSGRDIDLAFYIRTKKGAAVESPRLMRFGRSMLSLGDDGEYTFDVERNWHLAKHLMTHRDVAVQWIFVYKPLKKAMLRFARERGEPSDLLSRAEQILWQPSDSSKHHDHFHVRIFCPASDRPEGCLNQHPVWPGVTYDPEPQANRGAALVPALTQKDEAVRLRALDHVEATLAYDAAPGLAEMAIYDPSLELRLRALNILVEWHERDPDVLYALETLIRMQGEGVVKEDADYTGGAVPTGGVITRHRLGAGKVRSAMVLRRAWRVVQKMASPHAGPLLSRALKSKRVLESTSGQGTIEARLAAKAALHAMDLRLVPSLIEALSHEDRRVRAGAKRALRRVTNHALRDAKAWRQWWSESRERSRDELVVAGFRRAGVRVFDLDNKLYIEKLVKLTRRDDEIGYNADRTLARITGRFVPREASPADKHARWSAWYPEK